MSLLCSALQGSYAYYSNAVSTCPYGLMNRCISDTETFLHQQRVVRLRPVVSTVGVETSFIVSRTVFCTGPDDAQRLIIVDTILLRVMPGTYGLTFMACLWHVYCLIV